MNDKKTIGVFEGFDLVMGIIMFSKTPEGEAIIGDVTKLFADIKTAENSPRGKILLDKIRKAFETKLGDPLAPGEADWDKAHGIFWEWIMVPVIRWLKKGQS